MIKGSTPQPPGGTPLTLTVCTDTRAPCRPVQPQSLGAGHLAAVYLLTYVGAFAGLLLAASYGAQVVLWKVSRHDAAVSTTTCAVSTRGHAGAVAVGDLPVLPSIGTAQRGAAVDRQQRRRPQAWRCRTDESSQVVRQKHCQSCLNATRIACTLPYQHSLPVPPGSAQGGMLYAVLLPALALGLPFGLAVFPAHALRRGARPGLGMEAWAGWALRQGSLAADDAVSAGLFETAPAACLAQA